MVSLEFAEYHYFDDVLSDLKLTPVSCSFAFCAIFPKKLAFCKLKKYSVFENTMFEEHGI